MIQVLNYNHQSSPYNLSVKILNGVQLSNDISLAGREENFIKDICNRVIKSKSVLYLLKNDDDSDIVGLIALSVTSVNEQPALQIDYILVSSKYQGKVLPELEDCKPFRYLIKLAISLGEKISLELGLRYIVLSPDNNDLKEKYNNVGFEHLNDDWMYFKL